MAPEAEDSFKNIVQVDITATRPNVFPLSKEFTPSIPEKLFVEKFFLFFVEGYIFYRPQKFLPKFPKPVIFIGCEAKCQALFVWKIKH